MLERIEADPPRYLNAIYLTVMLCQNGSAIIVAILAERSFGGLGVTLVSVGFTLLYFVLVEAMSKTFGVLHSDSAALAVAPLVWFLGRLLAAPTRGLDIGVILDVALDPYTSHGRSSRRSICSRWPRSEAKRARSRRARRS